jgi:hypothetical protein
MVPLVAVCWVVFSDSQGSVLTHVSNGSSGSHSGSDLEFLAVSKWV